MDGFLAISGVTSIVIPEYEDYTCSRVGVDEKGASFSSYTTEKSSKT